MPKEKDFLVRFNALHENNKKHIINAVNKYNIVFTSVEQLDDFLTFCEKADILFQSGLAE